MVNGLERPPFKFFSILSGETGLIRMRALRAPVGGSGPLNVDPRRPEMAKFLKLIRNTKGATAIEYGLIAALIAVAAIAAMQNIGSKLSTTFNNVADEL
jgi:pilus assembly protein Flp/PilA